MVPISASIIFSTLKSIVGGEMVENTMANSGLKIY